MRSLITQELKGWPRFKPWTPWIMTDQYKTRKRISIRDPILQPKNPKLKQKEKRSITTNILYQIPPKQFIHHDTHYITNHFIKYLDNLFHGLYMFLGDNPFFSHQILLSLYQFFSEFILTFDLFLFFRNSRLLSTVVLLIKDSIVADQ